ncbi:MAG: cytidylyltransferase domain-containing protein [Chloroflexota bacterium]
MEPTEHPYTVAIIQARMGSSRLPGKVLRPIAGKPMLQRVVERTRLALSINQVAVATTGEPDDDPVAEFCQAHGIPAWRGSLHDVLDRYYQAARQLQPQVVVRITADCPLLDPGQVDRTVSAFLGRTRPTDRLLTPAGPAPAEPPFDFAANRLPPPWGRTVPIGLDTEVCWFSGLETVWNEARQPYQREHVMPYFYDHLERFRILLVNEAENYGELRWTVDTAQDLELVQQIYARFDGRDDIAYADVLDLWHREPQLAQINAGVQHKDYRQVDERAGKAG